MMMMNGQFVYVQQAPPIMVVPPAAAAAPHPAPSVPPQYSYGCFVDAAAQPGGTGGGGGFVAPQLYAWPTPASGGGGACGAEPTLALPPGVTLVPVSASEGLPTPAVVEMPPHCGSVPMGFGPAPTMIPLSTPSATTPSSVTEIADGETSAVPESGGSPSTPSEKATPPMTPPPSAGVSALLPPRSVGGLVPPPAAVCTIPTDHAVGSTRDRQTVPPPAPGDSEPGPRQLIVNYLPVELTDDHLRAMFEPFGPIDVARMVDQPNSTHSRGFGFVYFKSCVDASRAIDVMNGKKYGRKRMRVWYAIPQRAFDPAKAAARGIASE